MKELEIENNIDNNLEINSTQKNFLETKLGNIIDKGVNIGLKYVLPDLIEDEVIQIKNEMIKNGFSEGIKKAVESAIELGKSAKGIITGNFESVSQVQSAVKNGGIIDSISDVLNSVIGKGVQSGTISPETGKTIEKGKNTILNTISSNIEKEFQSQLDSIEKLDKYANQWKKYFQEKNFEGMQREYQKMQEKMKDIIPIENTIKMVRNINNLHNLIKNNGKNFELTSEQLEIARII